jgi:hypothetical protein
VSNSSLNLEEGGGLSVNEPLPQEIHTILAGFIYNELHKNPIVPLISQFVSFLQNGHKTLDQALLCYRSPVYQICPLKARDYKNGRRDVIKNKDHPAFEKWDALVSRFQRSLQHYEADVSTET